MMLAEGRRLARTSLAAATEIAVSPTVAERRPGGGIDASSTALYPRERERERRADAWRAIDAYGSAVQLDELSR